MASRFAIQDTVRVSREGAQTVEIALEQLTPTSVARVFSVSSVYIILPDS